MNPVLRKTSSLFVLALGLLFLPGGCTAVVDESELQAGCDDGTKACDSVETGLLECVSTTNPLYGCAQDSCVKCSVPHAAPRCSNAGECVIAACEGSYKDCDGKQPNGCEIDTGHDEKNCGACDVVCEAENAATVCNEGQCKITLCQDGYADCDGRPSTGCEIDTTSDKKHCGGCDQPCAGVCDDGVCL